MPLFKRQRDPLEERSKELERQITAVETRIHNLRRASAAAQPQPPKVRSTALPARSTQKGRPAPTLVAGPVDDGFESINVRNRTTPEFEASKELYNQQGVRKFNLAALWVRVHSWFQGPTSSNPKLVSYLVAGSIRGLRPLQYEKRIARNRFIALTTVFALILAWMLKLLFTK